MICLMPKPRRRFFVYCIQSKTFLLQKILVLKKVEEGLNNKKNEMKVFKLHSQQQLKTTQQHQ